MSFKRFSLLILLAALFTGIAAPKQAEARKKKPDVFIKFATVAPEGSTWMQIMHAMDEEVREATNNKVGFRIYAGGAQGDEPDVLRKMRMGGQLHAAGFTGNGLGEILPEVRILELPFLYRDKEEIDYITGVLEERFQKKFEEENFVNLGWAEVGYVYFFSNDPINKLDDLKGINIWSWEGDPLAKALFESIGINPRPLALPEVLTALQTDMLDAVYTSPLAAISTQWFTRVKYMNKMPITNVIGAVLITKKQFNKIPAEYRDTVKEICGRHLRELTLRSREDNEKSIEQLETSGLKMLNPPAEEDMKLFRSSGEAVRKELVGKLYPQELLDLVEKSLKEYRAKKGE